MKGQDHQPPSYSTQGQPAMDPSAPPAAGIYPSINTQQVPMVVYNNHTISSATFGPYPMRYTCPSCNKVIMTRTGSAAGLMTYLATGILFCLGFCLCCCLIPCCCKRCKDVEHRCPECGHKLGLFKRMWNQISTLQTFLSVRYLIQCKIN